MSKTTKESRIELTDRLRSEDRWAEASRRKDELVKELREGGMKRPEASELAWSQLAVEYPPLSPAPDEAARDEKPLALVGATLLPDAWGELAESTPFEAEVEWVHQNRVLVVEERPAGKSLLHWERARRPAPSYGAVNLMEYAATNRKGFMDILQRVKPGDGGEEQNLKRERRSIAEIRELLEQMRERVGEESLADVPKVVQGRVRSILADWSRQQGVPLSHAATASLEARVSDLVQRCIDATGTVEAREEAEERRSPE